MKKGTFFYVTSMKKILSLVLALALVLGLSAAALAYVNMALLAAVAGLVFAAQIG